MKLRIPTATLKGLLRAVKPFLRREPGTQTLPTLHLKANRDTLTVACGSTSSAVQITEDADVELKGFAVIPAEMLINLVNALPGEDTHLEKDTTSLKVGSGSVNMRLTVLQEDWDPGFTDALPGFVNARDFRNAITMVEHAASNNGYDGVYRGLQFEFSPEGLNVAACDKIRLAVSKIDDAGGLVATFVALKAESASLAKVFTADEKLEVGVDDAYLYVRGERATAKVARMEGEFLNYRAIIPTSDNLVRGVRVDAQALRDAVERANILASYVDNNRIDILIEHGGITVRGENAYGDLNERVDATPTLDSDTSPFQVSMNTKYLRDALARIEGTVHLGAQAGKQAPMLVAPVDTDAFLAVVAPLMVEDISAEDAIKESIPAQAPHAGPSAQA